MREISSFFPKTFPVFSFLRTFRLLSPEAKRTFLLVGFSQVTLGMLDLVAILLIGVIGSLAVAGISGFENPEAVTRITEILFISEYSFQKQIGVLGVFSAVFLVSKTLMSMWITRKILGFLSNQGRLISRDLLSRLLQHPNIKTAIPDTQKTIFVFVRGVSELAVGLLGSLLNLTADLSLLVILVVGLVIIDPTMAIFSTVFFASMAFALYGLLHKRARYLGTEEARLEIETRNFLMDLTSVLEQVRLRNLEESFAGEFNKLQEFKTRNGAEIAFLPLIGKYVLEAGIVLGGILLCAVQFTLKNSQEAIASLAVFLTAGTRITPAMLRLQQSSMKLKLTDSIAENVFELISELDLADQLANQKPDSRDKEVSETELISVENLTFSYSGDKTFALKNINLNLERGKMLSIVGPSGSGKSTLANLLVGSLIPGSGELSVLNQSPFQISKITPGYIGYVPQDIAVLEGTLARNIALKHTLSEHDRLRVIECVEFAQLSSLIHKLPLGIETDIRQSGIMLSGGEKQRLGIARALFSNPSILVLDEATSALDSETESLVSSAILSLRGKLTIVMIAHRLSTVMNSDKIIYLDNGKLRATGTFEELRILIPSFDKQAGLMGL